MDAFEERGRKEERVSKGIQEASTSFLLRTLVPDSRLRPDTTLYVTVLKACLGVAGAFAYGQRSGGITIVSIDEGTPRIVRSFKGHGYSVLDLDWSAAERLDQAFLLSVAGDHQIRVWSVDSVVETCILECDGASCSKFVPGNCSMVVVGTRNGEVISINCSTGRDASRLLLSKANKRREGKGIGVALLETNGANLVFALLETGQVCALRVDKCSGQLESMWSHEASLHSPLFASMSYTSYSPIVHGPSVLLGTEEHSCAFLSVPIPSGRHRRWSGHVGGWRSRTGLREVLSFCLDQGGGCTCVSFCPKLSLLHNSALGQNAELLMLGDDRGLLHVWMVASISSDAYQVSHLHSFQCFEVPVAGLSWCYGEDLLLIASILGEVLVWQLRSDVV